MELISLAFNGEEKGPYSRVQIFNMYKAGNITSETLFWMNGMPEWLPIDDLFGSSFQEAAQNAKVDESVMPRVILSSYNPEILTKTKLEMSNNSLTGVSHPSGRRRGYDGVVKRETSALAVSSLVFAFVFFPLALVIGHIARRQIKNNDNVSGDGFAVAALIIGYIQLAIAIIVLSAFAGIVMLGSEKKGKFSTGSDDSVSSKETVKAPDNSTINYDDPGGVLSIPWGMNTIGVAGILSEKGYYSETTITGIGYKNGKFAGLNVFQLLIDFDSAGMSKITFQMTDLTQAEFLTFKKALVSKFAANEQDFTQPNPKSNVVVIWKTQKGSYADFLYMPDKDDDKGLCFLTFTKEKPSDDL